MRNGTFLGIFLFYQLALRRLTLNLAETEKARQKHANVKTTQRN